MLITLQWKVLIALISQGVNMDGWSFVLTDKHIIKLHSIVIHTNSVSDVHVNFQPPTIDCS